MSWCEANPFTAGRELRERFSGMPGAFTWTKLGPGAAKSDATTQASAGFLSLSQQCSKSLERWDLSKPTRRSPSTFRPSSLFQANVVLIEDKASGTQLIQELIVEGCGAVTKYTPECEKIMRLHAQTGLIENGFVYLPETAPWLAEAMSGCARPA